MATKVHATWQEELADECQKRHFSAPVYNIVSDRRGGRTAWSATVAISGGGGHSNVAARFWYDGQYLNNAKEDAAEVACAQLRNPTTKASSESRGTRTSPGSGGNDWSH